MINNKYVRRTLIFTHKQFFYVVEDVITVNGDSYYESLSYQLDKTGTYRCTVEYVISGTGGADDVLTFEDTKTYG